MRARKLPPRDRAADYATERAEDLGFRNQHKVARRIRNLDEVVAFRSTLPARPQPRK